ncbi:amino acid ABC transporter permease [Pseudovibrio sp. Tun.PSC04-5.I4]|uniref:amino acid ABC transporter permease n=1 Tax=Pseudovibrio sp. Tun.PSC04-5.I4 TaxID=1798213 RepID=UPI000887A652|nr:amino acid ABC transporter permease [Pseudovibrio sp. Tun.PSC04-5.I4]SDQ33021.1 polar amino acid transport system permease protein [Pseudovibrio sp. Tun.PSC04-5.I4]SDR45302.1 polar amino acid transport system permease protein [Pseudovibrio sp. Tun.PSC04-5.I4]
MEWLQFYFNIRIVGQYADVFATGIVQTLWIAALCLVLSLIFGTFIALGRMSKNPLIWRTIAGYIQFIRATPLLIQIYLIYYGLPMLLPFGNLFDETQTGIIALTIHTSPYMGEIIRAGIESVNRGQVEAALSVGMSSRQTLVNVTLPQALTNVMPPLLGQTAVLIKDTSLLSIIAVFELMGAGLQMFSETVIATESYVTTAICYLGIYAMMLVLSGILQNKLGGKAWKEN